MAVCKDRNKNRG